MSSRTWSSTNRIAVALYSAITQLDTFTFACWNQRTGTGGSGLGRILSFGDGGNVGAGGGVEWQVYHESVGGASRLRFAAQRWATAGIWRWTSGWTDNSITHVAVSYDYGSLTNDPVFYNNGVVDTAIETTTPSGALGGAGSGSAWIGNVSAFNRFWESRIWDVAIWNRVLSVGEVRTAMHRGPMRTRSGLVLYLPLMGLDSPEPNYAGPNHGTVTGAAYSRVHGGFSTFGIDEGTLRGGFTAPPAGGGARSFVAGMIG